MLFKDVPTYKDDWGDEYYDFSNHPRKKFLYNCLNFLTSNGIFIHIFLLLLGFGIAVMLYQDVINQASRNISGMIEVNGTSIKVNLNDLERKDLIECKDGTNFIPPSSFIFYPLLQENTEIEGRDCT